LSKIHEGFREKPVFRDRSTFEIKHHIICDEVQKGESGSPIHISTDEQISKHFGKASIQDEKSLRTQAGAHGDDFLIEKGRDDSQVGREH
jgi:hypothetical protein